MYSKALCTRWSRRVFPFISARSHIFQAVLATDCGKLPAVIKNSFSTSDIAQFKPSFDQLSTQILIHFLQSTLRNWFHLFGTKPLASICTICRIQHETSILNTAQCVPQSANTYQCVCAFIWVRSNYWHNIPPHIRDLYFHFRGALRKTRNTFNWWHCHSDRHHQLPGPCDQKTGRQLIPQDTANAVSWGYTHTHTHTHTDTRTHTHTHMRTHTHILQQWAAGCLWVTKADL